MINQSNAVPSRASNVKSVGFCPERQCIDVEYAGGGCYRYSECDQKLFDALLAAPSIGKFVHANLKSKPTKKLS